MNTLHVVAHSPFTDTRLASCLRLMGPGDGLLLCGDGVYALRENTSQLASLLPYKVYALAEDVRARGVEIPPAITGVDYPGFVQLTLEYQKVNTWL